MNIILAVIFFGFGIYDLKCLIDGSNHEAILLLYTIRNFVLGYFFVRQREADDVSIYFKEWMVAFLGTIHFFFFDQTGPANIVFFTNVGIVFIVIGVVMSILSILSLGESIGIVPAHRGIKMSACYYLVRHPLYASYLLVNFGTIIVYASVYNYCLFLVGAWLLYQRAVYEEKLLIKDPAYVTYCRRVKARFLPGVF